MSQQVLDRDLWRKIRESLFTSKTCWDFDLVEVSKTVILDCGFVSEIEFTLTVFTIVLLCAILINVKWFEN